MVEGAHPVVNALAGIRVMARTDCEDTGSPFTNAEMEATFDPVEFPEWASRHAHQWFGPILGFYSGAWADETAQLRLEDIEVIDGVPGYFVRQGVKGQSIKKLNSRRFVPLAEPVIESGSWEYVEEVRRAGGE
ncbi:hypothetical protein BIY45_01320 [Stenotrophomonas sp. BIIR7]|nr:hypothetical protein BIY45_01320 [Stenotrophomonas sp. BIIR7]